MSRERAPEPIGLIKCSARSGAAIYRGTICLDILSWDDPDRAQDSQAAVREAVSAFLIARKRPILRHRCRQSGVIGTIAPLIRRETAALVDPFAADLPEAAILAAPVTVLPGGFTGRASNQRLTILDRRRSVCN